KEGGEAEAAAAVQRRVAQRRRPQLRLCGGDAAGPVRSSAGEGPANGVEGALGGTCDRRYDDARARRVETRSDPRFRPGQAHRPLPGIHVVRDRTRARLSSWSAATGRRFGILACLKAPARHRAAVKNPKAATSRRTPKRPSLKSAFA